VNTIKVIVISIAFFALYTKALHQLLFMRDHHLCFRFNLQSLEAGFHILIPFIDKVAYKQNLKEQAIDVASQICITKDNIAVKEFLRDR
jgi:regulator of protease activity HflC (stomatin/prohibitin superfamily)